MINPIREWLLSRDSRERVLIIIGGILLILVLVHTIIWSPLVNGYQSTEKRLNKLRNDVAWMRTAAKKLASTTRLIPATTPQGSLPTIVDRSARKTGIINVIKRVEPRGQDKVQVILQKARFTVLLYWISVLDLQHKISIDQISIVRDNQPGHVNVRIMLSRKTL